MAKKAARPAAPLADIVEEFDVEQRSEDWYELRRGVLTASNFSTIMASAKDPEGLGMRKKLLYRMAGEILTGEVAETYSNKQMERGIAMEPAARSFYQRTRFAQLQPIGFVRRTIHMPFGEPLVVGCSPDSFIGTAGILQIKTMMPELLIPIALKGAAGLPAEHRPQCQGEMWVCEGRDWNDLMLFYEGMPVAPTFRLERDESYIKTIKDACEVFAYDLRELVKKLRSMGPR
jgi:hypothetical protein